jgi:hypothetical protein
VFRGLLTLCESSPRLTDVILATEPDLCRQAAATIRANELSSGREFRRVDEAVLWLAAMLALAAAAAAVVPLYVLLSACVDRRAAWFAAAMWPLIPGIAVFLPKSDAVFPLISTLGPCLWLAGWRKQSLVCCALAGLVLLGGMLLSLAIAPIAVLTGLATVLAEWQRRPARGAPSARSFLQAEAASLTEAGCGGAGEGLAPRASVSWWVVSGMAAAVGFFVPAVLLWWQCDLNLPRVWSWNVANHALFYEHNTRTWWKWLLVNPLEAALAAGGPLAAVAIVGAVRSRGTRLFPLVGASAVVWGLLWISGRNMGEAARLWLLLQPWVVVAAAGALCDGRSAAPDMVEPSAVRNRADERTVWIALLGLQAIASIATVTRVDGFQLVQM